MSAPDSTHLWAVGTPYSVDNYSDGALVLFYDFNAWYEQMIDRSWSYTDLYSVDAISPDSVWTVDFGGDILHFDGTSGPKCLAPHQMSSSMSLMPIR